MFGTLGTAELVIILVIAYLPLILIAISPRTEGMKKLWWILLSLILSWIAYILFLVFTDKVETKRD